MDVQRFDAFVEAQCGVLRHDDGPAESDAGDVFPTAIGHFEGIALECTRL